MRSHNHHLSTCAFVTLTLIWATLPQPANAEPQCAMVPAFEQTNLNVPGGKTPVKKTSDGKALMFTTGLHINTAGTSRSYKVSDFWGEHDALNNLCNAMSDACAGLNKDQLKQRRELTQSAAQAGWPSDQLRATRISPSIIAHGPDGKPCTSKDGFLVSATSLNNPAITDTCNIERYVDALEVSALVLPRDPKGGQRSGFTQHGVKMGDLAAVWLPGSDKVHFAVVGDQGPANKLGEASIALNGRLLGKTAPPVNYLQLRGKKPYQGQDWNVRRANVVVFPGTRDAKLPYMTQERIDEAASNFLNYFGGKEKLMFCR